MGKMKIVLGLLFPLLLWSAACGNPQAAPQGQSGILKRPPTMHYLMGSPENKHVPPWSGTAIGNDVVLGRLYEGIVGYDVRTGEESFKHILPFRFEVLAAKGDTLFAGVVPYGELRPFTVIALKYPSKKLLWELPLPPEERLSTILPLSDDSALLCVWSGVIRRINIRTGDVLQTLTLPVSKADHEKYFELLSNDSGIWAVSTRACHLLDPATLATQRSWRSKDPIPGSPDRNHYFNIPKITPHGLVVNRNDDDRKGYNEYQIAHYPPEGEPRVVVNLPYRSQRFEAWGDFCVLIDWEDLATHSLLNREMLWARSITGILQGSVLIMKDRILLARSGPSLDVLDALTGKTLESIPCQGSVDKFYRHPLGTVSLGPVNNVMVFTFSDP
jgi:hypothetical protein